MLTDVKKTLRRCFPSLRDLAFLLPVLLLFTRMGGFRGLMPDGDTGWHIRTGDWILANGRVPDRDIFSFTKAGDPWFAWEWLWDVMFSWIHTHAGLTGVAWVSLLLICFAALLLYRLIRRQCPDALIAFAVFFLAISATTVHWLARPHVVTLLLVPVFLTLLERARRGDVRVLWLLPPLTLLWTNLHGGFVMALVLTGVYAAGELTPWLVESDPAVRRAALSRGRPYVLCAAGCALATLFNPYFYQLHLHIARYLLDPVHSALVEEMKALSFNDPLARYFEALLFLTVAAVLWLLSRKRYTEAFLAAVWLHPALTMSRNIPIFAMLAAPAVAGMLYELLNAAASGSGSVWWRRAFRSLAEFGRETTAVDSLGRIPLASVLSIGALIFATMYLPAAPGVLRAEFDPSDFPVRAVDVVRGGELSEGIFTEDQWGDYLIYRLYPATKVFVDGRSDFYGTEVLKKYVNAMEGKPGWRHTLDRYRVDAALLRINVPLANILKESGDWRSVYDDGLAIVFLRKDSRAARAAAPEALRSSAVLNGGNTAIARSPTIPITITRDRKVAILR